MSKVKRSPELFLGVLRDITESHPGLVVAGVERSRHVGIHVRVGHHHGSIGVNVLCKVL